VHGNYKIFRGNSEARTVAVVTVDTYSRHVLLAPTRILANTTEHARTQLPCVNCYVRSEVFVPITRHHLPFASLFRENQSVLYGFIQCFLYIKDL